MANALYDLGREKFLKGGISWDSDDIKCCIVNITESGTTYTPNLATDEFLNIIAGAAIIATSSNFTGKTTTAGVADADNVTFSAVTGDSIEAIVVYKDTGTASTSPLIAYIDTAASGLPLTPNGGDVTISWDGGANKIFKL